MNPPKQNPLTGTFVMEPEPPPRPQRPAPPASAPHPLERTMLIEPPAGDRTISLADEPPKTQAVPRHPVSLQAPFPVAAPGSAPRPAVPAPWQEVRADVSPADDARWSTLVVEPPAPSAPARAPAAPAGPADPPPPSAPAPEQLAPRDPWRVEPAADQPLEAPSAPAVRDIDRVVERKSEVRSSVYGRFKPRG